MAKEQTIEETPTHHRDAEKRNPNKWGPREEEILNAVLQRVVKDGMEGLTVKKIADEAQVSTALVHYHFSTKDDLVAAAWSYALSRLPRRIREIEGTVQGLEWMRALYRIIFVDRDPKMPPWSFWLEYWAKATRTERLREHHSSEFARMRHNLASHAQNAINDHSARRDLDPTLVADLSYALIYGLAVTVTLDRESISAERAYEVAKFAMSLLEEA